jgi:hypothetical protein
MNLSNVCSMVLVSPGHRPLVQSGGSPVGSHTALLECTLQAPSRLVSSSISISIHCCSTTAEDMMRILLHTEIRDSLAAGLVRQLLPALLLLLLLVPPSFKVSC